MEIFSIYLSDRLKFLYNQITYIQRNMNNIYSNMLKVAVLGAQAAHAVHLAASLRDCDTEANLVCRLWRKDDFSGDSYDIC